jgi:hypothetical protein
LSGLFLCGVHNCQLVAFSLSLSAGTFLSTGKAEKQDINIFAICGSLPVLYSHRGPKTGSTVKPKKPGLSNLPL